MVCNVDDTTPASFSFVFRADSMLVQEIVFLTVTCLIFKKSNLDRGQFYSGDAGGILQV